MKRRVTLLLLLVVGGAIVNFAVAWGCVLGGGRDDYPRSVPRGPMSDAYEDARGWPAFALESEFDWLIYDFRQELERRSGVAITNEVIQSDDFISAVGGSESWAIRDYMTSGFLINSPGHGKDFRALPFRPIWPGFAINTVFYAFILWLLFAAAFALRRLRGARRLKRGLCPKCAYPVGTNEVCTECGAAVVKQKSETQKAEIA